MCRITFFEKKQRLFGAFKINPYLCHVFSAQMAESVDALVSNTSGLTSMPVRSRLWVLRKADNRLIISLIRFIGAY